jgi:hypothetical protein
MKESDLYLPLKQYLESQNYEVKSEICDCDVVAVREEEAPVIIELKLTLNLDVLLQGVDRLALSSVIYVGIPHDCKSFKKRIKLSIKLLKMLGFGLILINPKSDTVEVLLDPSEYKPRKVKQKKERLLGEFQSRIGDPNLGGMASKKGVLTSYRQKALKIALYLEKNDSVKASTLSKELGEPKARDIMYKNFYGWFDGVSRGVYKLSTKGKDEIGLWLSKSK